MNSQKEKAANAGERSGQINFANRTTDHHAGGMR